MSEILLVNPRRRRRPTRARRRTSTRKRRRNPVAANPRRRRRSPVRRRSVRRRRSNPRMRLNVRTVQNQVMNAIPGAMGAMALDLALGYIPLPVNLKTGIPGYLTKAVGAIGLGMVAQNFVKAKTAASMTEGALTVMMYGVVRNLTAQFAPQLVPAGGMSMYLGPDQNMGYYGSGWNPNVIDDPDAMGTYLPELTTEGMDTDESGFSGMGAYLNDEGAY